MAVRRNHKPTTAQAARNGDESLERVGKREQHGDTNTDQKSGIDQTGQQEHFGLQFVHQFGLASGSLDVLTAHQADTDAGTQGTQANDQTAGDSNESNVSHDDSYLLAKTQFRKR
jgi:hypothetical protein